MSAMRLGQSEQISRTQLITISVSHYCEKARWSLDYCGVPYVEEGHFPLFHAISVKRAGGKRSVPVLKTDQGLIQGSSAIAAWADSFAPGILIPRAGVLRQEALQWQRTFDDLGHATRLWAYHHCLSKQRELVSLMSHGTPAWERSAFMTWYPAITFMMRRGMHITARTAAEAATSIDQAFRRVEKQLEDGRPFLSGDAFSIADIAFAALSAPVLLPKEHPAMNDAEDAFDYQARGQIQQWRTSKAGRFALGLYTRKRKHV